MSNAEKKTLIETEQNNLSIGIHPKVINKPQILEYLLGKAVECLLSCEQVEDPEFLESVNQLCVQEHPELIQEAEAFMKANSLPLDKLPYMLLLVMEGYKKWLYQETRDYLQRQCSS